MRYHFTRDTAIFMYPNPYTMILQFRTMTLVIALFLLQTVCYAQEERSPFHLSVYGMGTISSADLKKAVDNKAGGAGIGLDANVVASPFGKRKVSPMYLGVDLQYLHFGRDKIASTDIAPPYKTSFNYYGVGGIARVFPARKDGFNLFVDGMVGLKIMNARTKIDKNAWQTVLRDEQAEVINNATDTGLGYGAGVGFFNKRYAVDDDGTSTGRPSFSIRVMYIWGDEISYVKRGSLQITDGFVSYEKGYTRTDMIQIQIGVYVF